MSESQSRATKIQTIVSDSNASDAKSFSSVKVVMLIMGLLLLSACEVSEPGTVGLKIQEPAAPISSTESWSHNEGVNSGEEAGNVPARIVIESIGLDAPIEDLGYSATIDPAGRIFNNWDVTAYAAGWHVNSSGPGQGGNVVLSGHNNILGAVFKELDQLEAGDVASVWSNSGRYDYQISEVLIVPERDATPAQRRENANWIGEFDEDRLTLITCWPRNGNSHRIIVVGHLVGNAEHIPPQPIASQ